MTRNQLMYHANMIQRDQLKETQRSNKAREKETVRSNTAKELETNRANIAKETETHRHNIHDEGIDRMKLSETIRNNTFDNIATVIGLNSKNRKSLI